jgi:pimeloyl-ACP methyl ester carboxylesterase
MSRVTVVEAPAPSPRPPLVLVHGAANSSGVWRFWQQALAERGWTTHALDLRGHGESEGCVDGATMADYADDVFAVVEGLPETPVVVGWSMGGLVAMMVAARGGARACVGLAPSTPAATRDESVEIRPGVFGPEEYGITSRDPAERPAMPDLDTEERLVAIESLSPESRTARDDRKAGIVIGSLACPLLVVTGSEDRDWPRSAYAGMHLPADYIEARGASHWGLVLNRRVLPDLAVRVTGWLEANVT